MDCASAEGLEGLTIGRLATELRMSKTGIFAHFGSKEQLQLATVAAAKEIFLEQICETQLGQPTRGLPKLKVHAGKLSSDTSRELYFAAAVFAAS